MRCGRFLRESPYTMITLHDTHLGPPDFNPFQAAVARAHKNGIHAWMLDHPDWSDRVADSGDHFFIFVMLMLGDPAFSSSREIALASLREASADLVHALLAIASVSDSPAGN